MMSQIALILIILSIATTIQCVVGFGLALFAVPLLILANIPLLQAVFLVLCVSFVTALLGVSRLRANFDLRLSGLASIYRAIGMIPGFGLAVLLSQSSPAHVKASIGFAIGLGVLAQAKKLSVYSQPSQRSAEPVEPSRRAAPWAFLSSGLLMGWLGMGGPPLVFWLLTGRQDPKKSRVFLYGVYLLTIPFQIVLMSWHSPSLLATSLPYLAVSVPCCLLVSAVTLRLGDKLDVNRLQWLSLGLLTLLAMKAFLDWGHHVLTARG